MHKELLDELKKTNVMLVKLRAAFDVEKQEKEVSALALKGLALDLQGLAVELKALVDVIKRQGIGIDRIGKALEQRFHKLEQDAEPGPRKFDKYDEANARIDRLNAEQTNPDKLTFEQRLKRLEQAQP